jgi:hypothetical protein
VGDGAQEDSYSDSVWEHAMSIAMGGHTAADILAAREAAPNPDDLRSNNQQHIDALGDYRDDTADKFAHDREHTTDEDYRDDDDERLDEDTDLHSRLGY